MSRFLERQISHAEAKKLGRTERYCDFTDGQFIEGERQADAAKRPPNVVRHAITVGRSRGVSKPGAETDGERHTPPDFSTAAAGLGTSGGRRRG